VFTGGMSADGRELVNKLQAAIEGKAKQIKKEAAQNKRKKFFASCSITKSIDS
jgi:hypothetical protein